MKTWGNEFGTPRMAAKRGTQTRSTRFRLALQRMVGDDPDLELNQFIYLPRWSFRSNSLRSNIPDRLDPTEPEFKPEDGNSRVNDVRSEVTRDTASILHGFIQEDEGMPEITRTSASVAQSFATENEGIAVNLIESNAAQYLNGPALYLLVIGLMMAAFLLMIDSTILVTVG